MSVLLTLALVGCGRVHPFATGGYQHERFPIYVATNEAGRLISQDWLVDAWSLNVDERPVRRVRSYTRQTALALRHRTNGGRMWMDVVPVDGRVRDQELRVVGQEVVAVGNTQQANFGAHATQLRMLGAAEITLSGHAAHIVLIEGGDGAGMARGMVVFARANYVERQTRRWRVVPVMVIAGYVNSATDFEPGVPDFQRFLSSIQLAPSESGDQAEGLPPSSGGDAAGLAGPPPPSAVAAP